MLYLIDCSIYIFRAWQTLPPTINNTHGEQANAVLGFTETLYQILTAKKPEHIVCAFDKSHGTGDRYRIYPEYKANRPAAPPELLIQFERCVEVATAMGIPCFSSTRVEADDIIGSFAQVAQAAKKPVMIISADKDLTQFIGEQDIYWDFARNQYMNYSDIVKRFKIRPEQVADMLALCGDKVDNIPGIPGVGMTTAARLLKKWKTLDGVIENRDKIASMQFRGAPRVANLVDEHIDEVKTARQLTGLIQDDSLPTTLGKLKRKRRGPQAIEKALLASGTAPTRAHNIAHAIANSATSQS